MYEDHTAEALEAIKEKFYVYRCFDKNDACLYVGCTTGHPLVRLKEHKRVQDGTIQSKSKNTVPWVKDATRFEWQELPSKEEMLTEEANQIIDLRPVGNLYIPPTRGCKEP